MTYTIGQTSRLVGLPPKTIRFYEEEDLITPPERAENGYRRYRPETIDELKLLKSARDLGLPLSEIKRLMQGCSEKGCNHSREEIATSLDNYLQILETKIGQMRQLKSKLTQLKTDLADLNCPDKGYCCNLLHQLIAESGKEVETNG